MGVLGAGAVGQATLRMLSGFNCERILKVRRPVCGQSILIREADILVLAVHLMDYNRRLVNDDFIGMMKEGAYLINPARGSVVDERAVADALDKGRLSGYAADTFELEDWQLDDRPREVRQTKPSSHPILVVRSVREAIEQEAAENIIDALTGKRPSKPASVARVTVRGINREYYQWQTLLRRVLPSALRCGMKGTMKRAI